MQLSYIHDTTVTTVSTETYRPPTKTGGTVHTIILMLLVELEQPEQH